MPSPTSALAQRETDISLTRASAQVGWRAFLERTQTLFAPTKGYLATYLFLVLLSAYGISISGNSLISPHFFILIFLSLSFSALNRTSSRRAHNPDSHAQVELGLPFKVWNTSEAIVVYDARKKKFVGANSKVLQLFDYELGNFLQLGFLDVSPEIQPSGISSKKLVSEKLSSALRGERLIFD